MSIKKDKFTYFRHSVQTELISWAKFPVERKLGISLILLLLAFILGGYLPSISSALNVWGVIIFFEALLQNQLKWERENQKEIFKTYLYAGILGTICGSFLLLYYDVNYFIRLSLIDFLTRYIWFLLPLSRLLNNAFFKKGD